MAGREQGSHPMVQLQPHLRLCVAHGSTCSRVGGPLGGVPRASEGQKLGPGGGGGPALRVGFRRRGGSLGSWCVFQLVTLRRREMA